MGAKLPSVETVFGEAMEIAGPAERAAFLDRACGGDQALRRQVESLLDAHTRAGGFLESPAATPTITRDASPTDDGPGGVIGPYRLLEEIGEGGMGVVYMAEQTRPVRRRVALKVIKPGMDSKQVVARFEAERQALALMDHPNIAKVHDGGATGSGRPYFVMELVRGLPITDYCDREGLTVPERLELFVLVCRAVQHAHQKGVIHRDLKPSNVLVTVVDGVPTPKVIDFGVAKATGASLTDRSLFTGFHQLIGTPLYMSPEQADLSSADVDTRSDIYALGVLLYELLTGSTPFDRETFAKTAFDEMRRMIREDEPPTPSTRLGSLGERLSTVSSRRGSDPRRLNRAVRGELDWIAMKALEKDRRRRYETANDFAADVMRYLTDRPVEACPPSARYRLTKYARRNRTALATGAVVAVALATGSAVSAWQAVKATRAERRAEARFEQARRVVDDMYTQVAERWLGQNGGLAPIQREFLEKALAFYEPFAEERHDDPDVQFEAVRARGRVGVMRRLLGKLDQSEDLIRRSVDDLDDLANRFPDRADYRQELALKLGDVAALRADRGQAAEAEPSMKRSVAVMEAVVAQHPKDQQYLCNLARVLGWQGNLFERQKRYAEAEIVLRRSRDQFERHIAEGPHGANCRLELARVEMTLGLMLMHIGRLPEAEAALRRSIVPSRAILAESPTHPVAREQLAKSLINLAIIEGAPKGAVEDLRQAEGLLGGLVEESGVLDRRWALAACREYLFKDLVEAGRFEEAEEVAHRWAEVSEKLVADQPAIPHFRDSLGRLHHRLAFYYASPPEPRLRDPSKAMTHARRSVDLLPQSGAARQSLAWAHYRAGDWTACVESGLKATELHEGDDCGAWFFLAMAYLHLGDQARAHTYYERAVRGLADFEGRVARPASPAMTYDPDPAAMRRVRDEAASLLLGTPPEAKPIRR
ncbi:serine/threonine-protein kinase [Paludisphaera soli]|uniref:serine/threonine-protein kinase n=1 Tax=Paludisphaera soli TaxID=2712865 RepID=UPI0013EAE540|nr:serine/threonine-protein kinase [Paludisphaera soli]